MATAVHHGGIVEPAKMPPAEPELPEIIEERRKDSEGRTVVTKYVIGKLLGKGGFARCYLGYVLPSKQTYALKIVAKSSLVKSRAKQKLQTEIKIHRTLRHAHVVRFDRFFEDQSYAYMLLELCHNNSMSEMLKRRKRLTEPEARYYLCQLISSLKYLHQNLVIHRDLKLGNLFIDASMRIKVGDFGLATRVSHPDEKKRTVCGTPNYIAPEILEGKDGHSFEVDIWSTGVILYTLLIGKPPFESKDVKSTYKRILANQFTFPDHVPICEHAKSLIRSILQTKPERRPSLEAIIQHPFFTKSSAFTPDTLPECALREVPQLPILSERDDHLKPYRSAGADRYGDENDPAAINRLGSAGRIEANRYAADAGKENIVLLPSRTKSVAGPSLTSLPSSNNNAIEPLDDATAQKLSARRPQTGRPSAIATTTTLPGPAGRGVQPAAGAGSSSSNGAGSDPTTNSASSGSTASNSVRPLVLSAPQPKRDPLPRPQSSSGLPSTTAAPTLAPEKRGYSQKFEIYQDTKTQTQQVSQRKDVVPPLAIAAAKPAASSSNSSSALARPSTTGTSSATYLESKAPYASDAAAAARLTRSRATDYSAKSTGAKAVDSLTSGLEELQLNSHRAVTAGLSSAAGVARRGMDIAPAKQEAWTLASETQTQKSSSPPRLISAPSARDWERERSVSPPHRGVSIEPLLKPQPAFESEPLQIATPTDNMISSKDNKALGTLEMMHEVLSARGFDDAQAPGGLNLHQAEFERMRSPPKQKATVWVVRYVDYTSKYGLGFLLNTGSAGVYFNDSTKIVLSPDGAAFQYIERRRKEHSPTTAEHSTQTHLMSCYPVELQKKVTLLRHFRNYLFEQQKACKEQQDDGTANGDGMQNMPMVAHEGANSGASASVKFGASSANLRPSEIESMGGGVVGGEAFTGVGADGELPFLKKWVRTRHAILFRLSNRTVQVVFFDRSEILLSSEARMVTYVDKQGARSEHTLEDVLQTGRTDIAKRLKYSKDIMYRLINIQQK